MNSNYLTQSVLISRELQRQADAVGDVTTRCHAAAEGERRGNPPRPAGGQRPGGLLQRRDTPGQFLYNLGVRMLKV